jgi:hypothetical protein
MQNSTTSNRKAPRAARRRGVHIVIAENPTNAVRDLATARRVSIKAIYEAALTACLNPAAQDQRDARAAAQSIQSCGSNRSAGIRSYWSR